MYYDITVYERTEVSRHVSIQYTLKTQTIRFAKNEICKIDYVKNVVENKNIFTLYTLHLFITNAIKRILKSNTPMTRIYLPPNFLMEVFNDWDVDSMRLHYQEIIEGYPEASNARMVAVLIGGALCLIR